MHFENVAQIQRQFWGDFQIDTTTSFAVVKITAKFQAGGTVRNVQRQRLGRPPSSTNTEET